MQQITFETIQTAIDNVCSIEQEQDLDKLSQDLFDAQPGLAGFVIDFIEDMSEGAKDLGFMMALVLWKSFQKQFPNMRALSEDEVVGLFESQERELEKLLQIDDDMIDAMQEAEEKMGQPEIFSYVTQELFSEEEDDIKISEEEEIHLFMVLRFFSTTLNDLARESAEGPGSNSGAGLKH